MALENFETLRFRCHRTNFESVSLRDARRVECPIAHASRTRSALLICIDRNFENESPEVMLIQQKHFDEFMKYATENRAASASSSSSSSLSSSSSSSTSS